VTSSGEAFGTDAWVRSQTDRFQQVREQAEQVRAQLAQNTVTVSDGQGTVTLTVGSGGVMQSIIFGPRTKQLAAEALSVAVMRAYGQACRQAAEQGQQILGKLVGPDSPTLQLMRDAVPADHADPEADPDPDPDPDPDRALGGGTR